MVTHNRVLTLQNHSVSTFGPDQLSQLFGQKMGLNQLLSVLGGLSVKDMVLTHFQCLISYSFCLVFLTFLFLLFLHSTCNGE